MKKNIGLFLYVASVVIVLIIFESVYPRDLAAAKKRIEAEGYSNVKVLKTRRYCGKNRKVFRFTAVREDNRQISGRFCFDLIRPLSSLSEDPS